MKSWKVLLGLGGACAVCCSLPLAATFAAVAGGASAALSLAPGAVLPAAGIALAAIVAGAGAVAWRRRRAKPAAERGCCASCG